MQRHDNATLPAPNKAIEKRHVGDIFFRRCVISRHFDDTTHSGFHGMRGAQQSPFSGHGRVLGHDIDTIFLISALPGGAAKEMPFKSCCHKPHADAIAE